MKGKRVLITGGNAGIGKATAIALAKMGAEVIITARSESKAKEAVAEIVKASGSDTSDLSAARSKFATRGA
jgi:NAD(P)-dependent dehydrogenase (short-subunit alcohol dehydrogenase family)